MLEKVAENTSRASIMTKAEAHALQETWKIRAWRNELGPTSCRGGNSKNDTFDLKVAETKTQKDKGAPDTTELLTPDALKGDAKRPEAAKVLGWNSDAGVGCRVNEIDPYRTLLGRRGGTPTAADASRQRAPPRHDHQGGPEPHPAQDGPRAGHRRDPVDRPPPRQA